MTEDVKHEDDKGFLKAMELVLENQDMNRGWYILDDNKNVIKSTMLESNMNYLNNMNCINNKYIVKKENLGDVRVSTVFLGLDHSMDRFFGKESPNPLVFETMIFGGEHDDYQTRCSTWDEALKMHQDAVDLVKGKGND